MSRAFVVVLAFVFCIPSVSLAQDSVSKQQGFPGDAVSVYDATEQVNNYVVDLTPIRGSWGTDFGIAPLIKSELDSSTTQAFYSDLISAQAMSSTTLRGVPFLRNRYRVWKGQGLGVNGNSATNDPGTPVSTVNRIGNQFAVAFATFGGNGNHIVGGVVNYDPAIPKRLFVSRVVAAVNGVNGTCNLAQVGMGGVDASGNVHFRADDFGTAVGCGLTPVSGNNLYRVNMSTRNSSILNVLDGAGAFDDPAAHKVILANSPTVHNPPNQIPTDVAGRPVVITGNFNTNYVYESTACNLATVSTHLAFGASDQRGNVAYTRNNFNFLNNSGGTAAFFAKTGGGGGPTDSINVWGLDVNGNITGNRLYSLPPSNVIKDNRTGFDPSLVGAGQNEFMLYASQVAFRGGNGSTAVGSAQNRVMLAAGVVGFPTVASTDNPLNYIAVIRSNGVSDDWGIAAYSFDSATGRGKPILDGKAGRTVGWLTLLSNVTGGTPLGPSIGPPMIDSVGNIWFLGAIELLSGSFATGLVRGIYDPGAHAWDLELIFTAGRVFRGQNSDTDYQIRFLSIADSNSVTSSTAFSGNMNQSTVTGYFPGGLDHASPKTFGGLVINAEIVYDVNGDGNFVKVTGGGGDPSSLDQEYQVMLYLGSLEPGLQTFKEPAPIKPGSPRPGN